MKYEMKYKIKSTDTITGENSIDLTFHKIYKKTNTTKQRNKNKTNKNSRKLVTTQKTIKFSENKLHIILEKGESLNIGEIKNNTNKKLEILIVGKGNNRVISNTRSTYSTIRLYNIDTIGIGNKEEVHIKKSKKAVTINNEKVLITSSQYSKNIGNNNIKNIGNETVENIGNKKVENIQAQSTTNTNNTVYVINSKGGEHTNINNPLVVNKNVEKAENIGNGNEYTVYNLSCKQASNRNFPYTYNHNCDQINSFSKEIQKGSTTINIGCSKILTSGYDNVLNFLYEDNTTNNSVNVLTVFPYGENRTNSYFDIKKLFFVGQIGNDTNIYGISAQKIKELILIGEIHNKQLREIKTIYDTKKRKWYIEIIMKIKEYLGKSSKKKIYLEKIFKDADIPLKSFYLPETYKEIIEKIDTNINPENLVKEVELYLKHKNLKKFFENIERFDI